MIKCVVFDFDAVLADSLEIKSKCFVECFELDLRSDQSSFIREYHLANGGVPREQKIKMLGEMLLQKYSLVTDADQALMRFNSLIQSETDSLKLDKDCIKMLHAIRNEDIKLYINSAGNKDEIISILDNNGVLELFEDVLGSENSKDINFREISSNGCGFDELIFVGDAQEDYNVALRIGVEFILFEKYSAIKVDVGSSNLILDCFSDLSEVIIKKGIHFD